MLPGFLKTASAIVLLAILAAAVFPRSPGRARTAPEEKGRRSATLAITGMTCDHCAESIRRALLAGTGIETVDVDRKSGTATVSGEHFDVQKLLQAVEASGYKARVKEE
jgi:copper chaperone CopZ